MDYKYDIALSFAGEDRKYVEKVATLLKEKGVRVFYDKFEQVDLWGKDLGIHFDYVYRRQSKYFVPFISIHYQDKIWTNYEVRTAISRAIENKEEYILPVHFDRTELDGIRSTIGFLDISSTTPEKLAEMIIQKLGKEINIPIPEKEEPKGQIYLSTYLQVSEFYGLTEIMIGVNVTNIIKEHRYFNGPYFKISQPIDGTNDTFQLMDMVSPVAFPKKMEYGEQYQVYYNLKKGFLDQLEKFKGQDVKLTAYVTTTVGEKFSSNQMKIDDLYKFKE